MSSVTSISPITVEQYLLFKSPAGFRDELIEGEIVLSPDSKALHQEVAHQICRLLERKLKGSKFVARQRTNMRMPQDHSMPSPDVFVIDKARWLAAITEDGYPLQSPQLAVEVISRSNTKKNVSRKAALYGASAVSIVYPRKKIVHVLNSGSTTVLGLDDRLPLPLPLPDSVLTVKQIFSITTKTL